MGLQFVKGVSAALILGLLTACTQPREKPQQRVAAMPAEPARFLALGDSYTIGEAVASNQRWPAILVRRLRQHGIEINKPVMVAKTAWSSGELASAMDAAQLHPPYDLVSLLIGVNDQYRGYPLEDYEDGFEDLLKRAIALAGEHPGNVIVVSIPDWGATPFARKDERSRETIGAQIDAYNAVNARIAREHGAHYVNITDISRRVIEDITLVANDGLHPSGRQYRRWVGRIYPVAYEILTGRAP